VHIAKSVILDAQLVGEEVWLLMFVLLQVIQ
jgi:hypothetical protein